MTRIESFDGTELHVVCEGAGNGPVIMLAHSVGCDLTLWHAQARTLGNRYRIIRYDTRGHGRSQAPRSEYDVEDLGRDALAILDAFGIDCVHHCGLSLGGTTGQWLALHAPDRLASLILADTSARLGTAEGWQARIDAVRKGGTASIADMSMTRFFSEAFRQSDPATVERFRQCLIAMADHGFAGCCAVLRDCDFRARLSAIATPTLVICGEKDGPAPPADSEELAAGIAHAALVILPDAGHISAVEAADAFTTALDAHVRAAEAAR